MLSADKEQVGLTGEGDASISERPCDTTKHPDLTSVVLQSQDPFIQALMEARRATELAVRLGRERLAEVDQRYYDGLATRQDLIAEHAYTMAGASARSLDELLLNLQSKINSAPIYRLPVELMCSIFANLDMDTLLICRAACRLWSGILASKAARKEVWCGTSVILRGSMAEVNAKWQTAHRFHVLPASLTLRVDSRSTEYEYLEWKSHGFLTNTLRELRYEGSPYNGLDTDLWKSIPRCSGLKLLHWTIENKFCYRDDGSNENAYRLAESRGTSHYDVRNAFCRLEELALRSWSRQYIRIDNYFVQILCQVKRLDIFSGLSVDHVLAILGTAQGHLEDISLSYVGNLRDPWIGAAPQICMPTSNFFMSKLRCLSVLNGYLRNIHITAPHLTSLHFGPVDVLDWGMLDLCRKGLKCLHIELCGEETSSHFGQELFDMPQLVSLHLDYTRRECSSFASSPESILGFYQDYSAAAFWDNVKSDDNEKMQTILPRLEKLHVVHDPLLDEQALMRLIDKMRLVGHPPLKEMIIHLANHCSHQTDRLQVFANSNAGFTYQTFNDWKTSSTREWWEHRYSLSWLTGMDWISIEFCKYTLERLHINAVEPDDRLEQELFDMPILKRLNLVFAENSGASATALWRAISTGTSDNPEVGLRDILPNLDDLMVFNDVQLDEKLILKFIEMRQSLGLQPLWRLTVKLARDCSEDHARLDSLKETMPNFSYKLFDQS